MSLLPKKFSLLLLLLTFTGAQPSDHNVLSILKTKFDAILNVSPLQEKSRSARTSDVDCWELKDDIPPLDVINKPCKALRGDPVYTLKVENAKGPKWDEFTLKVNFLDKIILEIVGSDIPTLKLDKLDTIGGSKDITFKNNKDLKEISFTLKGHMTIGQLIVTGNDELESIKISTALTFGCTEVIISKNPKLKTLEFVGAGTYTIPKMEISHNIQLKSFGAIEKLKADGSLLIEDNRLLEEETLNRIRAINGNWNIQPFGHCIFNSPIQKLEELNSCVVVNQLKFAKGASGTIGDLKLNRVEDGDVVLADLPRDKAQFLEQVDGMTKISSDVCDFGNMKGIKVTSPTCPATTPPPGSASDPSSNSSSISDAPSSSSTSWWERNTTTVLIINAVVLSLDLVLVIGMCIWQRKLVFKCCTCGRYGREKPAKNGSRTPPSKTPKSTSRSSESSNATPTTKRGPVSASAEKVRPLRSSR